ncbi:hypothetical protein L596_015812 [Steinernema carpocapsae]|uniref:Uncharacterized protein n=1 Tax=Steinernema carpocapsae TaxID=34508 RepID=A0A4U5NGR2_STECR|nr:hypothetical protein L596_015812 [Steinernema carpocapsae]
MDSGTPSWVVEAVRPTNKISASSMTGGYTRKISSRCEPPAMSRKRSMRSRMAEIELNQAIEGRKFTPPIGVTVQLAPKKKSISSARIDLLSDHVNSLLRIITT